MDGAYNICLLGEINFSKYCFILMAASVSIYIMCVGVWVCGCVCLGVCVCMCVCMYVDDVRY